MARPFPSGGPIGLPPGTNIDAVFLRGGDGADLVISFDTVTDLSAIGGGIYDPADLVEFQRMGAGSGDWRLRTAFGTSRVRVRAGSARSRRAGEAMGGGRATTATFLALLIAGAATGAAFAEEARPDESTRGWDNSTELSLVVTQGNSSTETFGFKDTVLHTLPGSQLRLKMEAVRANAAGQRFRRVDPGFDLSQTDPADLTTTLVEPPTEPDAERYFVEGRFDRKISPRFFWNAGASWDRNSDAGIENRYIAFAGLGNVWKDDKDLKFRTSYGLSITDREEQNPDPLKGDRFGGLRFESGYSNRVGANTVFGNDWTVNVSLRETSDYTSDMTNAVAVSMNRHVALKVSLQWLYAHEPAFEILDVLAYVDPETGLTVPQGGSPVKVGTVPERKKSLDSIFNTSLVITF